MPHTGWAKLEQARTSQVHPLLCASSRISTKTSQVLSLVWEAPGPGALPEGATRTTKQHFHEFALAESETQSTQRRAGFTFCLRKALRYFNTFWHMFFLADVYNNPLEAWNWNMFDIWYILFFDYWQILIYYGRSVRNTGVQNIIFFPIKKKKSEITCPSFLLLFLSFSKRCLSRYKKCRKKYFGRGWCLVSPRQQVFWGRFQFHCKDIFPRKHFNKIFQWHL